LNSINVNRIARLLALELNKVIVFGGMKIGSKRDRPQVAGNSSVEVPCGKTLT